MRMHLSSPVCRVHPSPYSFQRSLRTQSHWVYYKVGITVGRRANPVTGCIRVPVDYALRDGKALEVADHAAVLVIQCVKGTHHVLLILVRNAFRHRLFFQDRVLLVKSAHEVPDAPK